MFIVLFSFYFFLFIQSLFLLVLSLYQPPSSARHMGGDGGTWFLFLIVKTNWLDIFRNGPFFLSEFVT